VLIEAKVTASVTVANRLRFTAPGNLNFLLYWKYLSSDEYEINVMGQATLQLANLISMISISATPTTDPTRFMPLNQHLSVVLELFNIEITARVEV
jgi:hypothetical protein